MTRGPRGAGRETCPGARRAGSRGPPHTGPRLRPRPYRRAAAEDEAATQGCSSEPGVPVLGGGPVPMDSHSERGLPSPDPGGRGPGTPPCARPRVCQRERVRARPACREAVAAAGEIASGFVRPHPPIHCPASPARALAAEQHGERRLARGMNDVRRRSHGLAGPAVRARSKQTPPPGFPKRGGGREVKVLDLKRSAPAPGLRNEDSRSVPSSDQGTTLSRSLLGGLQA